MDVAVVGGGIGGLSAALALSGGGYRVTALEQTERFEAVGAGIVLAPNAVRALGALGVELGGVGQVLSRTEIRTAAGALVSAIDLQALARRHGPSYGIARPALHALLATALPASVRVEFGARVASVAQSADGAVLRRAGAGAGTEERFDVVVAADGLRSAVRASIGGPTALRYSGTTCWRGVVPLEIGDVAVEAWGRRTRVGVVPIGEGLAYYYLVATAPAGTPQPLPPQRLQALFAGYGGLAGRLLDALGARDEAPPLHHDLHELDRPFWGRSRILLLGDAAHAMTPNQGQGAAMAIEDAAALALALRPGVDGGLDRYRQARARRVRRVQLTSRRIGVAAHWSSPVANLLRDKVMRLTPPGAATRYVQRLVAPGVELATRLGG